MKKNIYLDFFFFFDDSALTRVLNYFINFPAKKNWGVFNKQSLVSLQLQCTGTKVNTISHFKWNPCSDTMAFEGMCIDGFKHCHQEQFVIFVQAQQRSNFNFPVFHKCKRAFLATLCCVLPKAHSEWEAFVLKFVYSLKIGEKVVVDALRHLCVHIIMSPCEHGDMIIKGAVCKMLSLILFFFLSHFNTCFSLSGQLLRWSVSTWRCEDDPQLFYTLHL